MSFSPPGYAVLATLGRGTTATVYRVRREADGAELALKHLEHAGEAERAMFRQEFWRMRGLAHPHLVAAHELGEDFFTLDLVDGPGLPAAPLDAAGLRAVLVPAARALGYLHGRQLVHGDLKPENLRFDAAGNLRLLDLGFLRPAGRPGKRQGTLEYMAPEVIRGEPVDPRSDLYALGVLAYQLLAGRLPFEAASGPLALMRAQLEAPPPDLAALRPDLPRQLVEAVLACLAKDVGDRPPSAAHLLARLGWGEPEAAFVGFGATLVGRDAELAAARAQVARQLAGEAGALALRGPAGNGKSRLLAALATLQASGGDDVPYRLLTELLQAADDLLPERGLERGDERWQALRALMPAWGPAPEPLEPRAQASRLRQALLALLGALGGVVVALDDWALADRASRDLLAGVLERGTGGVAWVVADGPEGLEAISPAPLGLDATATLVASALGEAEAPAGLAELAHQRAGGSPGRIRDALAAWIAGGALVPRHGRWSFDAARADAIPLGAADRLPDLTAAARRVAGVAAVLGQVAPLAAVVRLAGEEAFPALAELEAAGVLVREGEAFRFAGTLRGAALAGLSEDERTARHRAAAELDAGATDAAGLTRAARHWLGAGAAEAAPVVLAAVRANVAQGTLATARELLDGLSAADPDTRREAARLAGDLARMGGDGQEALARYEEAIGLARELGDQAALGRELVSAGRTAMMLSQGDAARAFLTEALPLCAAAGNRGQEARALMTLGRVDFFGGKAAEGREAYERAAELARAAGEDGLLADALSFLGGTSPPNDPAGRARLAEALAVHRRLQNPLGLIEASIALGDRLLAGGELAAAHAAFTEALATCRAVGSSNEEAFALLNLSQTALERGNPREALASAEAAQRLAATLGQRFPEGFARVLAAQARLRLGDFARATEDAAEAVATAEAIGATYLAAAAQLAAAQVALEAGDAARAGAAVDAALAAERKLGDPVGEARAVWLQARLAQLEGHPADALIETALAAARTHGARFLEAQVLLARAYGAWRAGAAEAGRADAARAARTDAAQAARTDAAEAARTDAAAAAELALALGAAELAGWARWQGAEAEARLGNLDAARALHGEALAYAETEGVARLEALAALGLAAVAPHAADTLRPRGERALRTLARAAGREGFERWPEHRLAAAPAGAPAAGLAEALAMVDDLRHAATLDELARRLLTRLVDFAGAQAGALIIYREHQVGAVALSFLEEQAALERPEVEAALWERRPVLEGTRWALPVEDGGELLAIAYLEDGDPGRQATLPALAEAMRLSLSQFVRLQAIEAQVERLALSDALARLTLEGLPPPEILQEALRVALQVTGAERALVLRIRDADISLVAGVDAQGRALPADAPYSSTVCRWVASTKEPVRLVDAQQLEGWQQAQSILALGLRTLVAVPLARGGQLEGVLYVDSTDVLKLMGDREQGLLEAAARVVAPVLGWLERPRL